MANITKWYFKSDKQIAPLIDAWAKQSKFTLVKSTPSTRLYQGSGSLKSAYVGLKFGPEGKVELRAWLEVPFITQLATLFLGPKRIGIEPGIILQPKRKKMANTIRPLLQALHLSHEYGATGVSANWTLGLGVLFLLWAGVNYFGISFHLSRFHFEKLENIYFYPNSFKWITVMIWALVGSVLLGLHYWFGVKEWGTKLGVLSIGTTFLFSFIYIVNTFYQEARFMGQFSQAIYFCMESPNKEACDSAADTLGRTPATLQTKNKFIQAVARQPRSDYQDVLIRTLKKVPEMR